jgi:hypothetical protein
LRIRLQPVLRLLALLHPERPIRHNDIAKSDMVLATGTDPRHRNEPRVQRGQPVHCRDSLVAAIVALRAGDNGKRTLAGHKLCVVVGVIADFDIFVPKCVLFFQQPRACD